MNEFKNNYILNVSNHHDNLYVGTNGNGLIIYSLKSKSSAPSNMRLKIQTLLIRMRFTHFYWMKKLSGLAHTKVD